MNVASILTSSALALTGLSIAAVSDSGNAYVERVVDGDTVVLGDGSSVRLIGIDAPEADEPCGETATEELRRMVEGRTVQISNPAGVQESDKYGRALRYLDRDVDPAASLLTDGLAAARYDSTDGFESHPRQARYHALEATALTACPTLDRESRWFGKPERYIEHVERRRQAARAERRAQRETRRVAQRDRARQERVQRARAERERFEVSASDVSQPDAGYTGLRCYAPGGETWKPC